MKTQTIIIGIIIFVAFILGLLYIYEIPTMKNLFPIFLGLLLVTILILTVENRRKPSSKNQISTSIEAIEYAKEQLKTSLDYYVDVIQSTVRKGYVPSKKGSKSFYGMILSRGGGMRIAAVVYCNPKDVTWVENPDINQLDNPFLLLGDTKVYPVAEPLIFDDKEPEKPPVTIQQTFPERRYDDADKLKGKKRGD